ncbi:MAG TPA: hypothetical protein VFH26_00005, partial [Gemmatimonadales bacterium]|nr:hypothetical protein [Gemmatimonadales bacterium]
MSLIELQQEVPARHSPPAVVVLAAERTGLQDRGYRFALGLAVALGITVRAFHVLSYDFPLNDGGLFFAMVRDLQAANYHLPAFTSYNVAAIPFGYSPLGFYLAGLLDDLLPLTLLDVFRWLPLTVTGLIVVAFAWLARGLLASRTAVVVAVVAFGLLPRSFIWMLMGGGLTRSLGFLFALVTLRLLYAFYTERHWKYVPLISVGAGLTLLSHLGTAPFTAFSALLFLLAYGRHRRALIGSVIAAGGAALVSAPWWYSVVQMHGIEPFLAAGATGGSIFGALRLQDMVHTLAVFGVGTAESVLAVIGMLGVLGFLLALSRGDWLLPAWWISIVLLDARQGSTFSMVPVALLAGIGVTHLLLPALRRIPVPTLRRTPGRAAWPAPLLLGLILVFATASAFVRNPAKPGGLTDMGSLSSEERAAMSWVERETSPDARFLIVSGTPWEIDRTSEWLPVLANRKSVATVQGYEWRPIGEFARKKREYVDLQGCAGWTSQCIRDWARSTGLTFTHVYIPKSPDRPCCQLLRFSLERDPA